MMEMQTERLLPEESQGSGGSLWPAGSQILNRGGGPCDHVEQQSCSRQLRVLHDGETVERSSVVVSSEAYVCPKVLYVEIQRFI
jgi:hypothetical protein